MFIDLSVDINEKTPVYPGDPATRIQPAGVLEEVGYQDHLICMGTHVGTHMDAPSHMLPGGKNLTDFPLETFSGRGTYIRVDGGITLDRRQAADIQEGDIVLLNTGMSSAYQEPTYFETYPTIPEEVASHLIEKGIKILGVDMCSVDTESDFRIHKLLLGAGVLIIENLTNLESLEGKSFKVHAFPMKLQLDGAPVRVVAEV